MNVLGLDLGTVTGWAVAWLPPGPAEPVFRASGVVDLSVRRGESAGVRFLRFRRFLEPVLSGELVSVGGEDGLVVAYEHVRFHRGGAAGEVYGGLLGTLLAACAEHGREHVPVAVSDVKRAATGRGNADKVAVVEAARRRWPDWTPENVRHAHDEADARWVVVAAAAVLGPEVTADALETLESGGGRC